MNTPITPRQASKMIKQFLDDNNISYTKITSKTVNFSSLGVSSQVFTKIWGWNPNTYNSSIVSSYAKSNGFFVEYSRLV